jgi:hypothetical protein
MCHGCVRPVMSKTVGAFGFSTGTAGCTGQVPPPRSDSRSAGRVETAQCSCFRSARGQSAQATGRTLGLIRASEKFDWRRVNNSPPMQSGGSARPSTVRSALRQSRSGSLLTFTNDGAGWHASGRRSHSSSEREPSLEQVAAAAALSLAQVEQALSVPAGLVALDGGNADNREPPPRSSTQQARDAYERVDGSSRALLSTIRSTHCPEQQRQVIALRYGFTGGANDRLIWSRQPDESAVA